MKKTLLILFLCASGCVATSSKDGLKRPDFSKARPRVVAPVTTESEDQSFEVTEVTDHVAEIGSRNYLIIKKVIFKDLGPVDSAKSQAIK